MLAGKCMDSGAGSINVAKLLAIQYHVAGKSA